MIPGAPELVFMPRWEWRTFAGSLPAVHSIGNVRSIAPRLSEDTYLLQLHSGHETTIRKGRLHIRQLRVVDAYGLELWYPVFKAKFPLYRDDIRAAFHAWRLSVPELMRSAYSEGQFVEEIIIPNANLRVAHVKKADRRFAFLSCSAEWTDVRADGVALETFCLRNENGSRILDALRDLGFDSNANVNYPRGLMQVLGFELSTA